MTPEERARQQIDLLLQESRWIVQDRSEINLAAGPGVAIREARLKAGEADYLLFAHGKAIATVEAKAEGNILKQSMSVFYRLIASNDPLEKRWRKRQ
jgi:type I restriction enzyme R subunit